MIIRGKVSKILPNDNNEISITTNNNSNAFEQNTSTYIYVHCGPRTRMHYN